MARTPSNMLKLGTKATDFKLFCPEKNTFQSLNELQGEKGTLIIFMCNHCPFVVYIIDELVKIADEYSPKRISFIGINANDVENFPEDSPEKMIEFASTHNMNFAYLYDETQEIAKMYDAACTPDLYLFDENMLLIYRGQLDDARPGNSNANNGKDLRNAIENLLLNLPQDEFQKPSLGCNIKWKI